jgi:hypothetical protein
MKTRERPGLVVARYRRHVTVEDADGRRYLCQTRARHLDPLTGDEVRWHAETADRGVVDAVLPRRSALTRVDSRGRPEVVAARTSPPPAGAAARPAAGGGAPPRPPRGARRGRAAPRPAAGAPAAPPPPAHKTPGRG